MKHIPDWLVTAKEDSISFFMHSRSDTILLLPCFAFRFRPLTNVFSLPAWNENIIEKSDGILFKSMQKYIIEIMYFKLKYEACGKSRKHDSTLVEEQSSSDKIN